MNTLGTLIKAQIEIHVLATVIYLCILQQDWIRLKHENVFINLKLSFLSTDK